MRKLALALAASVTILATPAMGHEVAYMHEEQCFAQKEGWEAGKVVDNYLARLTAAGRTLSEVNLTEEQGPAIDMVASRVFEKTVKADEWRLFVNTNVKAGQHFHAVALGSVKGFHCYQIVVDKKDVGRLVTGDAI